MNEWATWETEQRLAAAAKALEANGFPTTVAEAASVAADLVAEAAAEAKTVGFGGSVALLELDLPRRLAAMGKECLIHSRPELSLDERVAVMRRQLTCDLFLSGVNAVTLDGKIVNVDATGNRVGAMAFGPGRVILVAGASKIVADVAAARERIRNFAAPANARRLSMKTPCAETGFCSDCASPQRICRIVHVMEKRPRLTDVRVILVAEPLGL